MDQETQNSSLITWIVVVGIFLVVVISGSAYVIANPESIYRLFGGTTPVATAPVVAMNGPAPVHEQTAHTKHYANIFYEFDYPDTFTITSELVNSTHAGDGTPVTQFGSSEIVFTTASTSDEHYTLRITSLVNANHRSPVDAVKDAEATFNSRPERGANDSFQDISSGDVPAYKEFTAEHIYVGIPTQNLNFTLEMLWGTSTGVKSTGNNYLGIIEDSFTAK